MKKFEVGQIVYVFEHWSGSVIRAEIEQSILSSPPDIYGIRFIEHVNRKGEGVGFFGGNSCRKVEDIWPTIDEAYAEINKRSEETVQKYLNEIKTVEELLKFPLEHCLNGGEYLDCEAVKAYKMKAKEMMGIEI